MATTVAKRTKTKPGAAQVKIAPHSLEAEQSVLGGLILDNQAWDKIAHLIQESDFYRYEHRLILRAMQQLERAHKPFDVVTLTECLKAMQGWDHTINDVYLYELANNTPSIANIVAYAEIVRERSVHRQLIAVATDIADSAYQPDGQTVAQLLDNAEQKVFAIAEQTARDGGLQTIQHYLKAAVDRVDTLFNSPESITGLKTGFADFDEMTTGLQPAELILLLAVLPWGKRLMR